MLLRTLNFIHRLSAITEYDKLKLLVHSQTPNQYLYPCLLRPVTEYSSCPQCSRLLLREVGDTGASFSLLQDETVVFGLRSRLIHSTTPQTCIKNSLTLILRKSRSESTGIFA